MLLLTRYQLADSASGCLCVLNETAEVVKLLAIILILVDRGQALLSVTVDEAVESELINSLCPAEGIELSFGVSGLAHWFPFLVIDRCASMASAIR